MQHPNVTLLMDEIRRSDMNGCQTDYNERARDELSLFCRLLSPTPAASCPSIYDNESRVLSVAQMHFVHQIAPDV